jgi:hypothetical protein
MTFRLAVLNIPTSDQLCSGTERGRLRLSPQVWWDRRGGRPHLDRSGRSRLHLALNMRIVCATVGLCLTSIIVQAADLRGSSDHPLVPRYEGSEIISSTLQAFTTYSVFIAPIPGSLLAP